MLVLNRRLGKQLHWFWLLDFTTTSRSVNDDKITRILRSVSTKFEAISLEVHIPLNSYLVAESIIDL